MPGSISFKSYLVILVKLLHDTCYFYFYPFNLINVVTKTGNDHKPPQTTTMEHKRSETPSKQRQTTRKKTTNYQQTITNGHSCTSNQKADVLFRLPTPGNYKDYLDFERHM